MKKFAMEGGVLGKPIRPLFCLRIKGSGTRKEKQDGKRRPAICLRELVVCEYRVL